jgi:hypothetical protein
MLALATLCVSGQQARAQSAASYITAVGSGQARPARAQNSDRPLLAFYYMWYSPASWSLASMSDLPAFRYGSGEEAAVDRHLKWAAGAGITGFIGSWWGSGDQTNRNFALLLARAAVLDRRTGYHFASTIYLECGTPALSTVEQITAGLRYVLDRYGADPHFFRWHGRPVIFVWNPLGQGRSLATWAAIRARVDPGGHSVWSAEGTDSTLLTVFDGIHLFSAGYWGLQDGTMAAVDQGFRAKVDAYNAARHGDRIWAAGVLPGYNDTRVPGRSNTYIIARSSGATYRQSWDAALSSRPDWITITTFNEWYEGAMIEPSIRYGDLYLRLTAEYARRWHG